jgi:hypothetical protein
MVGGPAVSSRPGEEQAHIGSRDSPLLLGSDGYPNSLDSTPSASRELFSSSKRQRKNSEDAAPKRLRSIHEEEDENLDVTHMDEFFGEMSEEENVQEMNSHSDTLEDPSESLANKPAGKND